MIEIWSEILPQDFRWTPDRYIGGTNEFVIETAGVLARNNEVIVYYDGEATEYNGVYYLPREQYQGDDIVIACNDKPPKMGKKNLYWTSKNDQKDKDYLEFDYRVVLSKYHQSIFGNHSIIIPLACWPEQFKKPIKESFCLYSSSPDRGLDFLKSIWNEVENKTGAKLISTYNKSISETEMIKLYKKAQFWLHPGQGVELFCISAYKAQVAGCVPVVVPNMALDETVKFGTKTTLENYKNDLIKTILNPPKIPKLHWNSWEDVTKKIKELYES